MSLLRGSKGIFVFLYLLVLPLKNQGSNFDNIMDSFCKSLHSSSDYNLIFEKDCSMEKKDKALQEKGCYFHSIECDYGEFTLIHVRKNITLFSTVNVNDKTVILAVPFPEVSHAKQYQSKNMVFVKRDGLYVIPLDYFKNIEGNDTDSLTITLSKNFKGDSVFNFIEKAVTDSESENSVLDSTVTFETELEVGGLVLELTGTTKAQVQTEQKFTEPCDLNNNFNDGAPHLIAGVRGFTIDKEDGLETENINAVIYEWADSSKLSCSKSIDRSCILQYRVYDDDLFSLFCIKCFNLNNPFTTYEEQLHPDKCNKETRTLQVAANSYQAQLKNDISYPDIFVLSPIKVTLFQLYNRIHKREFRKKFLYACPGNDSFHENWKDASKCHNTCFKDPKKRKKMRVYLNSDSQITIQMSMELAVSLFKTKKVLVVK